MSSLGRKIASNTIYQLIGKAISMSITMLVIWIVSKNYGREGYGVFSLMQTWPALFFVIIDFGLNAIASKELTTDWSRANKIIGNIFIIRLAFSLVLMVGLAVALLFFPYSWEVKTGIIICLPLIITQSLYTTANIVFQVKLRYDLSTVSYLAGYIAILILVLICTLSHLNVVWISFVYVVGGVITFVLNWNFLKKLGVNPEFKIDKKITRYLVSSSLPLGIMFVFSQISFKADSILISVLKLPVSYALTNTESVGVYALPYKIFEVALVFPTFFMNSTYPVMVSRMGLGKESLKSIFLKSLKVLSGMALAFSLMGIILSPLAINLLGGAEFQDSILVLRILLAGLVFYYLTQPLAWLVVTLGEQNKLPYVYLVSALFNVTTNYIFIQRYSFYASAVITHLSEALILVMLIWLTLYSWKKKYA
jgi:O-antigen/teichoic acid export membrane protein